MKTNDIKKGMIVELDNGWFGEMFDNMKGNTRMVKVYGLYTEIGSVYAHDIIACYGYCTIDEASGKAKNGEWIVTEHTQKQLDLKSLVASY